MWILGSLIDNIVLIPLMIDDTSSVCRVDAGGNRRVIDDLLKADMLEVLRANDQLKRERKLGKVFLVHTLHVSVNKKPTLCPNPYAKGQMTCNTRSSLCTLHF